MDISRAFTTKDKGKIEKLNTLTNKETFWNDVRKFTKSVHNDNVIKAWQCYAEMRYAEIITGVEDVHIEEDYENGKMVTHYYDADWNEVYPIQ